MKHLVVTRVHSWGLVKMIATGPPFATVAIADTAVERFM